VLLMEVAFFLGNASARLARDGCVAFIIRDGDAAP